MRLWVTLYSYPMTEQWLPPLGAGGQTCYCLWSESVHWSNLSGDTLRLGTRWCQHWWWWCVSLPVTCHDTLACYTVISWSNLLWDTEDMTVTLLRRFLRHTSCHDYCFVTMSQLSVTISGLCPRPWGCLQTVTHCVTHNVTNPCYVTPVCHEASWVRLCHDPRDAPEAPVLLLVVTRLQSPVTRPRHALHQERGRVCQCQQLMSGDTRGKPQNCQSGSNVNVSVIHPR